MQQHPAGFVGYDQRGHFVHYCRCGKWGAFGYEHFGKAKLGKWYCGDHRPEGPVPVIITISELWRNRAIEVGKARNAAAAARGYLPHGSQGGDREQQHINGALGEVAVAKHFRLPWRPNIGVIDGVDVGGKIEVRSVTVPRKLAYLGIRAKDKDDLPFVLAHIHTADSTIKLIGWLYGHEGKNRPDRWSEVAQWWWNPPPYRPISELVALVRP